MANYQDKIEASQKIIAEQKAKIRAIKAQQKAEQKKFESKRQSVVGAVVEKSLGLVFDSDEKLKALEAALIACKEQLKDAINQ